jgi:hypothetical protein
MELPQLKPKTKYHFKITCQSQQNISADTSDQQFVTLGLPDEMMPANVLDLTAQAADRQVLLAWQLPVEQDLAGVVILRSTKYYPLDQLSGEEIYRGWGKRIGERWEYLDQNLVNNQRYYYTVFVLDKSGNYSSGALVNAIPQNKQSPVATAPSTIEEAPVVATSTPVGSANLKISDQDFEYWQQGLRLEPQGGQLKIVAGQPLTIILNSAQLPAVVKSIVAYVKVGSLQNRFWLKFSPLKKQYAAIIQIPESRAEYMLSYYFLNNQGQSLAQTSLKLLIQQSAAAPKQVIGSNWLVFLLLLIILLLLLVIFLLIIAKRKKNPLTSVEPKE